MTEYASVLVYKFQTLEDDEDDEDDEDEVEVFLGYEVRAAGNTMG